MNISGNITVFTNRNERCFWYKIYDLEPEEVFTVHSRGCSPMTNHAISPTVKYSILWKKSVH